MRTGAYVFIGNISDIEKLGYRVTEYSKYYLCQKDNIDFLIIKVPNRFCIKNEIFDSHEETYKIVIDELLKSKLIEAPII